MMGLPGGPAVKNPPATQGHGLIPGLVRSQHVTGATKPESHIYWSPCSVARGATTMEKPCSAPEKAPVQQRRPTHGQQRKSILKKSGWMEEGMQRPGGYFWLLNLLS